MSKDKSKGKAEPKSKAKASPSKLSFLENNRAVYIVLFAFAFLLYANTIMHNYALDDIAVVSSNKFVQQGFGGIPEILSTFYWKGFWDENAGLYRPMSLIVFAIEWQFVKNSPHVFHFVNIVLYALSCVLLYRVLRRLLPDRPAMLPFFTVLLFIALPVHTEVVANIKSLDEILSLLFFCLSMNQLLNFAEKEKKIALLWASLLFLCALLSKEGAVLFFPVMALALWYFTKLPLKKIAIAMTPLAVAGLAWFALHSAVIGAGGPVIEYDYRHNTLWLVKDDFVPRIATAVGMMGRYLVKLVVPYQLSWDYSYNEIPVTGFGDVWAMLGLLLMLGLLFLAIRQTKEKTILSFSIWWFFITIALTSNLFILIGATMADRFLYIPSVGFCLAAAWLLLRFTNNLEAPRFSLSSRPLLILCALLLPYSIVAFNRNADWKEDSTLYVADADNAPGSARIHYNYALMMRSAGDQETDPVRQKQYYEETEKAFLRSAKIDTLIGACQAYQGLGELYYKQKRSQESIAATRQALRRTPWNPVLTRNLSDAFMQAGQYDSAIVFLKKTIESKSEHMDTWSYLGKAYLEGKKDTAAALDAFKKGTERFPAYAFGFELYGNVLGMSGNYAESIRMLEKAYALNPDNPNPLRMIAVSYERIGNQQKTQEYLNRFLQAGGKLQ